VKLFSQHVDGLDFPAIGLPAGAPVEVIKTVVVEKEGEDRL
jgi:hypothetical protein